MAKGPPKQGRGMDARKASIGGDRKRMSNRELDQDGWVQVIHLVIKRSSAPALVSAVVLFRIDFLTFDLFG
jgi:hypothetical protein